jgi:AraC-like DNA-binding protein
MRQEIERENDPRPGVAISSHGRDYSRGFHIQPHAHGSDQLIYASCGVMEVSSGQSRWTIPPHFGLWVPARTRHEIRMPESVSMRTLYLRPKLVGLKPGCAVLHVSPLLREVVLEIVRRGKLRYRNRVECALCELLVEELKRAAPVLTVVMMPMDQRAAKVAQRVMANPADRTSLHVMSAAAGASVRTIERVFRKEVRTGFASWRRQVRLMKAVELLISGRSVKETAFEVGYQNPSALVSLFRGTFGTTPKAWISAMERLS